MFRLQQHTSPSSPVLSERLQACRLCHASCSTPDTFERRRQNVVASRNIRLHHANSVHQTLTRRGNSAVCCSAPADEAEPGEATEQAPRDDDVLPDNLTDALYQASSATADALNRGVTRCMVEVLLPEFWDPISGAVFSEEGDQQRFWKLSRRFIDNLKQETGVSRVKVVFPDMGVAAMLKNQWQDVDYGFGSLNDRRPVSDEDELVVIAAPDPQSLQDVVSVTNKAAPLDPVESDVIPVVLFNPRLASGDAGIGLNIRRMRTNFLSTFTTTYSLRPIGDVGSVFRRYPSLWQVFVADPAMPGRYKLAAEKAAKPDSDSLDLILSNALGGTPGGEDAEEAGGLLGQVGNTLASVQRFMKALSR